MLATRGRDLDRAVCRMTVVVHDNVSDEVLHLAKVVEFINGQPWLMKRTGHLRRDVLQLAVARQARMFGAAEIVIEITVNFVDIEDDVSFAGHADGDQMGGVTFARQGVVRQSGEIVAVTFFRFQEHSRVLNIGVVFEFEIGETMSEMLGSFSVRRAGETSQADQQRQLAIFRAKRSQQFAHVFYVS